MIAVLWLTEKCAICGGAFTEESWDARHSGHDGEELHEACCETSGGPCFDENNDYTEGLNDQ